MRSCIVMKTKEDILFKKQCQQFFEYFFVPRKSYIDMEIYVADINLMTRLKEDYGIDAIAVEPGSQAVDNRIKGIAGDRTKMHKCKRIVIVSHDKGYEDKIEVWKRKYYYKFGKIERVESIRQALG